MREVINSITNNIIFKTLIIIIFLLTLLQVIIVSSCISSQTNPNSNYRDYKLIYKENYPIIKMLLSENPGLPDSISFGLYYSNLVASRTYLPICHTHIYDYNISNLNKKIQDEYAFEYCDSYKLDDNYWLNYIITPKIGIYRIVIILNVITLIVILSTIIFYWLLLKIILPIKKFQSNAYKLGMTLVKEDIQPSGIKMLHQLSNSLNFMQNKLFNALTIRTKMLSMITHDLKAPITRLKLRYELGLVNNSKNLQDIVLLEQLSNQILLDIRENMFEYEKLEKLNLEVLLIELCNSYSNIEIINIANNVFIKARKSSLIRAFDNLISNSKKYSEKVSITISSDISSIQVSIKDFGPGIKESELKNIFRPFYQPDGSKHGNGLGLTITREIILSHDGSININNHNQPHGVIVDVKLPY